MKLEKLKLIIIGISIFIFLGCVSTLPKWIMNPEIEGYYTGVGSAEVNSLNNFAVQRNLALLVARGNLRKKIEADLEGKEGRGSGDVGGTLQVDSAEKLKSEIKGKVRNSEVESTFIDSDRRLHIRLKVKK